MLILMLVLKFVLKLVLKLVIMLMIKLKFLLMLKFMLIFLLIIMCDTNFSISPIVREILLYKGLRNTIPEVNDRSKEPFLLTRYLYFISFR